MLKRRQFIKALGLGAGAAAFSPIIKRVIAAPGDAIPRRVVFVVHGNGIDPAVLASSKIKSRVEQISGQSVGDKLFFHNLYTNDTPEIVTSANLGSNPTMSAIADAGLSQDAALLLGLSNTVTGGGHSGGYGALSCTRSRGASPEMQTIDSLLAGQPLMRRIGGVEPPAQPDSCVDDGLTPFSAFRLGVTSNTSTQVSTATCAHGKNKAAPSMATPQAAYLALFGSVAGGSASERFRQNGRLLDFARRDADKVLQAFGGSSFERAKIEKYLSSIEELECRRDKLSLPYWKGSLQSALMSAQLDDVANDSRYSSDDALTQLDMQFDLATAALIGQLTNVVVLNSTTMESGLGVYYNSIQGANNVGNRHTISHQAEGGDGTAIEILRKVYARHVDMIARMASRLAATPEVGHEGSMLDYTTIVYMSDNGEKHHASGEEWPVLMVGGKKLGLQTDGRAIIYPKHGKANFRQVSNLFNTLCYAAGMPKDDFGGESDDVNNVRGRLEELLPAPV